MSIHRLDPSKQKIDNMTLNNFLVESTDTIKIIDKLDIYLNKNKGKKLNLFNVVWYMSKLEFIKIGIYFFFEYVSPCFAAILLDKATNLL